ncbi:MAG: long-chain fatty acid--CoA ligase [Actinobacteria bacterium]|nr:long-chain fatty acid--CoA ligase [Actinomycetota bacterium]
MTPDVSLGNWMKQRALRSPNRRAITFEGLTLTYAQLQDRIDRTATVLREGGIREGDRVGYLGLNHPAFLETMFAAARLGAIFVPLNFRLTGAELEFIINDAGCHTMVADSDHTEILDSVRDHLSMQRWLSVEATADGWDDLVLARDAADPIDATPAIDPESVAVIMYTSGTTGLPKGAMLTHANFWWNNTNATSTLDLLENDVSLVIAPLFHIGGLNVISLATMQRGGELVIHRSFDPNLALEDVPKYGVTTIFGVPAMFLFMSQLPTFNDAELMSIRMLICGGAPVPEPLMKVYAGRGIPINQGYGLTETAPLVTFLTDEFGMEKIGSAGKTPLFCEIKLVDDGGSTITDHDIMGEVCVQGPNVMKGYWNRPEATAEAIDELDWFHTGDIGYLDSDGFLFIADRVKDMVISGGENVYPAEIESVLYEHPAIIEVAVIGVPDERWGEAVTAIAVLAQGEELTLDGLRDFAGDKLARFKLPTQLQTIDEIPRNAAGKVLKRELRSQFG